MPPFRADPLRPVPLRIPGPFRGVTDGHEGERFDILRKMSRAAQDLHAIRAGMEPYPHRTEPQRVGGKHQILGGRCAVIGPEIRMGQIPGGPADENRQRGVRDHRGVGMLMGNGLQRGSVLDHHEAPGLLIARGSGMHGAFEDRANGIRIHGIRAEGPDTAAGEDGIEGIH